MTMRPPVVAVADGNARLLLRRETIDDLLALANLRTATAPAPRDPVVLGDLERGLEELRPALIGR